MGWESTSVFPLLIIPGTGPPLSGLFVYSPNVGPNKLVDSIAAIGGTDGAPGNSVLGGVANYNPAVGPPIFAVALQGGAVQFFSAASEAGPWTSQATINTDAAGNLDVSTTGAGTVIVLTGGAGGAVAAASVLNANSGINVNNSILSIIQSALGLTLWQAQVSGDTNPRAILDTTAAGVLRLRAGPGNAAPDINIARPAAGGLNVTVGTPNLLSLLTADLDIATIGRGLRVAEGANARMGLSTLVAGSVTVANTTITSNTRIFMNCQSLGGTQGLLRIASITPGTNFTISSSNAADTSTVAWLLVEPG